MKFLPLIWSNLQRKKLRTVLTLLSIVVALPVLPVVVLPDAPAVAAPDAPPPAVPLTAPE